MPAKHGVVIPAYNAARYIRQNVMSVLAQLGPEDTVVVVNDGSTDATVQEIQAITDRRLRLVCQPKNTGAAAVRNRALNTLQADYVHFLDHDDLWPPDRMRVVQEMITEHSPDIVSGWVEHFYCPLVGGSLHEQYALPPAQAASLSGTVVFRRCALEEIGSFDEHLPAGEFVEFLSRAMVKGFRWVKTQEVLLRRRIHGSNHSLTSPASGASYLTLIRRHLHNKSAMEHVSEG